MSVQQKIEKALPSVFQGKRNCMNGCLQEGWLGDSAGHGGRRGMRGWDKWGWVVVEREKPRGWELWATCSQSRGCLPIPSLPGLSESSPCSLT